jgi:hypothetical protein
MLSQLFELPWDHRNAPVLPLKLATFFLDIKSGSCNNAYMLLEFQKINKQMTAKPIVDYFQRVCHATIMHESWNRRVLPIPENLDYLSRFSRYRLAIQNKVFVRASFLHKGR